MPTGAVQSAYHRNSGRDARESHARPGSCGKFIRLPTLLRYIISLPLTEGHHERPCDSADTAAGSRKPRGAPRTLEESHRSSEDTEADQCRYHQDEVECVLYVCLEADVWVICAKCQVKVCLPIVIYYITIIIFASIYGTFGILEGKRLGYETWCGQVSESSVYFDVSFSKKKVPVKVVGTTITFEKLMSYRY